ncbi:hypothetical protein EJ07DRAFT_172349 [Lizonia empirigonia]|nr:hypothetical protein EJ07DRAFT_172349 [Lizonia empirigonia]
MHLFSRLAIASTIAVGLSLMLVLNFVSAYDPTSIFFSPRKGYTPRYSTIRRQQAEAFITSYNTTSDHKIELDGDRNKRLCVGIPSFGREGAQYVSNTVGSLLEGLTPEERRDIFLVVFIPHTNPTVHPVYGEEWLGLTDYVLTYELSEAEMQHVRDMENEGGLFLKKGLYDYSYLLSKCAEQYTPYIAILEDDTIAMDGWYHRTLTAISDAERQSALRHAQSKFLYLRLFYTEQFMGWNSEEWGVYLYYSICAAAIPTAILLILRVTKPTTRISRRAVVVIYALLAITILLFFALGRTTVLPLAHGVHEMSRFGCCSQALVFPRDKALELVRYFKDRQSGFQDVLIEEFANENCELRFATVPSLMQHVGIKSSKTKNYGPTYKHKIWSFGFENYDWRMLRKEHKDAVRMR